MGNSIISSRIKETRIDKKLSQEELSEKSGLSLRTIQRLENGESVPRGDTLKRLTNALELPVDYFNNIQFENKQEKNSRKAFVMPWFLIGFLILCSSLGFILGLVLVIVNIIPYGEFGGPIVMGITILFSGIGIVIGNLMEKKYRK